MNIKIGVWIAPIKRKEHRLTSGYSFLLCPQEMIWAAWRVVRSTQTETCGSRRPAGSACVTAAPSCVTMCNVMRWPTVKRLWFPKASAAQCARETTQTTAATGVRSPQTPHRHKMNKHTNTKLHFSYPDLTYGLIHLMHSSNSVYFFLFSRQNPKGKHFSSHSPTEVNRLLYLYCSVGCFGLKLSCWSSFSGSERRAGRCSYCTYIFLCYPNYIIDKFKQCNAFTPALHGNLKGHLWYLSRFLYQINFYITVLLSPSTFQI